MNPYEQRTDVESMTMHGQWVRDDIAILRLREPLVFNDYVQPVCIPSTRVDVGTECFTTGWGDTEGTVEFSIQPIINFQV